LGVTENGRIF